MSFRPRWWMRAVACLLALAGCGCTRAPEMSVTRTPDGLEVAVTEHAFHQRFPAIAHTWALESGSMHVIRGLYDAPTHSVWVIAHEPQHLTADERWVLAHERAHRCQDLHGWNAAAPLWAALPEEYRTHADIEQRLHAEGWLP